MQDVKAAVIAKVGKEAEALKNAAAEEAARELEAAQGRLEKRAAEMQRGLLEEAEAESNRIIAMAIMDARKLVAAAKAQVMRDIIARARSELAIRPASPAALAALALDAMSVLGECEDLVLGVAARDMEAVRVALEEAPQLAARVANVVERPIEGGVIVETADGALVLDNSYAARLEMLLPRVLARFGRELF
jgi:vacuolar-type H+-ATPase subunit E/Vma4